MTGCLKGSKMNSNTKQMSTALTVILTVAVILPGAFDRSAEAGTLVVAGQRYVQRYNLDGSGGTTVFSNPNGSVQAIAFNSLADEIYYYDVQGWYHKFRRYNVSDSTTDIISQYYDNQFHPHSMDVDPLSRNAYIHYEQLASNKNPYHWIERRNVDTNSTQTIHNERMKSSYIYRCNAGGYCYWRTDYYHDMQDVAVDSLGRKVYWTDKTTGTINRKNIDGPGSVEVVYSNLVNPHSLALDVGAGTVFWSDLGNASNDPVIRRGPMGGGVISDVVTGFTSDDLPRSIDVDPSAGHIYWAESTPSSSKIRRADYSGANVTEVTNPAGASIAANLIAVGPGSGSVPQNPLLPDSSDQGFGFDNVPVPDDRMLFFDPDYAIGYDYSVDGPNFASVLLPQVGDGLFDLYFKIGGSFVFDQQLTAGEEFTFAPGGVSRFRILGIEESAELDPDNPLAFVTGLTFTAPGSADVTMKAYLPEPSSASLLLTVGLLRLARRRRK